MATLAQLLCATGTLAQLPAGFVNSLLAGKTIPSMSSLWTYGTLKAAFRIDDLAEVSLRGHLKAANLLPELTPGNFPGLISLDLSGTTLSSSSPLRQTILALAPQLRALDLSRCRGLTSYALDAVYSCSALETLKVASTGTSITSVQFQQPPSASLAAAASDDGWSVASSRRRRGGAHAAQQVAATEVAPPQQFPAFGRSASSGASASPWSRGSSSWRAGSGGWRDTAPPSPPPAAARGTFLPADEHSSVREIVLSALPPTLLHLDVSGCAGGAGALVALPQLLGKHCPWLQTLNAGHCTAASHADVQAAWIHPARGLVSLRQLSELHLEGVEWPPASQLALLTAPWHRLQALHLQPHEGAGGTYRAAAAVPFYDLLQVPAAAVVPRTLSLLVALPSPDVGGAFPVGHCVLDLTHGPLAHAQELHLFFAAVPVPPGQWRPHTSGLGAGTASAASSLQLSAQADMRLDVGMLLAALPSLHSLGIANCTVTANIWLPSVPLSVRNAAKRAVAAAGSCSIGHGVDGEVAAQVQADTAAAQQHIQNGIQARCLRQLELFACSLAPGSLATQLSMQPQLERVCFRRCQQDEEAGIGELLEPAHLGADIALAPAWLPQVFRSAAEAAVQEHSSAPPGPLSDASIAVRWGGDDDDDSDSDEELVHSVSTAGVSPSWGPQHMPEGGGGTAELGGTPVAQHARLLVAMCGHSMLPSLQQLHVWGAGDVLPASHLVLLRAVGGGAAGKRAGPSEGGPSASTQGGSSGAAGVPTLDQLAAMWNIAPVAAPTPPLDDYFEGGAEQPACAEVLLGSTGAAPNLRRWAQQAACDVQFLNSPPAVGKFETLS